MRTATRQLGFAVLLFAAQGIGFVAGCRTGDPPTAVHEHDAAGHEGDASVLGHDASGLGHDAAIHERDATMSPSGLPACQPSQAFPVSAGQDVLAFETGPMSDPDRLAPSMPNRVAKAWELDATVVAHGDGIPPEGASIPGTVDWRDDEVRWIRIRDAADLTWTIVAKDLPAFGVDDGTAVHATYTQIFTGDFGARRQHGLALAVDGQLAFYFAQADSVASLWRPEGVSVEDGASTCEAETNCFVYREYELLVSIGGADPVAVARGQSEIKGDHRITNISNTRHISGTGCFDGGLHDTALVITRVQP